MTQRGHMGAITPQGVGRAGNRSPAKGGRFHRPGPSSFPGCCCCRHGRGSARPDAGGVRGATMPLWEPQEAHSGHQRPGTARTGPGTRPPALKGQEKASQGAPEGRKIHRATVNGWGLGASAPMSLSIHQNLSPLWGLQKAPRRAMVKLLHQYQTAPGGATRRRASLAQKQGYHKTL